MALEQLCALDGPTRVDDANPGTIDGPRHSAIGGAWSVEDLHAGFARLIDSARTQEKGGPGPFEAIQQIGVGHSQLGLSDHLQRFIGAPQIMV
jgi:hypothetical protein